MNVLMLLGALLPWADSALSMFTRIFLAISVLSVEMQLVTLTGVGSLYSLVVVNAVLAAVLVLWQHTKGPAFRGWTSALLPAAPWPAVALLGAGVLLLNLILPLEAADPYHLERVAQIERLGTLEYEPAVNAKINVLGWVYELILADVRAIPRLGPALLHLHGVFGYLLYLVTLAAVQTWVRPWPSTWPLAAFLVIPPVFHQLVLIKNDLFLAAPAFVALVWLVTSAQKASWKDAAWAGWLIGLVVGTKLTNLPLALAMAGGLLFAQRLRDWRPLAGLALGGAIGAAAGGLFFTFYENARWYGDIFASGPVEDMGGTNSGLAEIAVGTVRFGISLFDLGLVTREVWPGRGGWGGTFGLPFIWALGVLLLNRRMRDARWALWIAAVNFLAFAAAFPDADLAHRLVLAPALLMIVVAVHMVAAEKRSPAAALALAPVLVLSGAQIVRSAMLYLARG